MPRIQYKEKQLSLQKMKLIIKANEIIEEYAQAGYDLTLRQLYYQFVARGLIPNNIRSYKRLGGAVEDGRMIGSIDWDRIVDRMRSLKGTVHWDDPKDVIREGARSFEIDKWANQKYHVEVWVEKDALIGVLARVCKDLDVDFMACRGYMSTSGMWRAAMRMEYYRMKHKHPVVIHLGDHDPSGIDMTRDIDIRFEEFGVPVRVERLALTMDQVLNYDPPPNPAKLTDSRVGNYISQYGMECWELDALQPEILTELIRNKVLAYRNEELWQQAIKDEREMRDQLYSVVNNWDSIMEQFHE